MSRIFISYRRSDATAEAGRICDYLENQLGRESIFKDDDAIYAGDDFRDRIHEAVGQCQVLLAVIGKSWLQIKDVSGRQRLEDPADWVRLEIETALNRNIRVIPILLDGVEMPTLSDLPTTLQPLVYRQAARIRQNRDFRRDMERVLDVIERTLANLPEPSAPSLRLTPKVLNTRGLKKYEAKEYREAITDYDQALRLNPYFSDAYRNRGYAKYALGDKQGAIADYDQALRLNPDDGIVYHNRGYAKYALGDKQGAIADLKKAAGIHAQQGNIERHNSALNQLKTLEQRRLSFWERLF